MLLCQFLMHSFQHRYNLLLADTTETQAYQDSCVFHSWTLIPPFSQFQNPVPVMIEFMNLSACLFAFKTNSLLRQKVVRQLFVQYQTSVSSPVKWTQLIISSCQRALYIKKSLILFNINNRDFLFFNKFYPDIYAFSQIPQQILTSYLPFWGF